MKRALNYAKHRFVLVWLNALIIIIPIIVFIITGNYVQNTIFPIASDFRVIGYTTDKNNNFIVKMQFYKEYSCTYKFIRWYLLKENGKPVNSLELLGLVTSKNSDYFKEPINVSLLDQLSNESARSRPKGRHIGGPWRLEIDEFIKKNINLENIEWNSYYGIVTHECPLLPWTSVSLIGPFDFPNSYKLK